MTENASVVSTASALFCVAPTPSLLKLTGSASLFLPANSKPCFSVARITDVVDLLSKSSYVFRLILRRNVYSGAAMLFAFAAAIFHNAATCLAGRNTAGTALAALFVTATATLPARAATDTVDFRPAAKAGSHRQSKVIVEVEGKLKLNADGKEVKHLPIKVHGELHY